MKLLPKSYYFDGIRSGNRAALARAITLVESTRPEHQTLAQALLEDLLPFTGQAHRIGISGVPGVGKSTFIERFGKMLTGLGHKVAVLAVDPSSALTGGSILGDKTRMTELATDPEAFIRPSPSSGTLGGVARRTRETLLLCEAAGFDVVLVETVGVGQSETVTAALVDVFMVLLLPGGGDELQGIKRGILEVADILVVNKADGEQNRAALLAKAEFTAALRILRGGQTIPVLTASALYNLGLSEIWEALQSYRGDAIKSGELNQKRRQQQIRWMWTEIEGRLEQKFRHHPQVKALLPALERQVAEGFMPPTLAAEKALSIFLGE